MNFIDGTNRKNDENLSFFLTLFLFEPLQTNSEREDIFDGVAEKVGEMAKFLSRIQIDGKIRKSKIVRVAKMLKLITT